MIKQLLVSLLCLTSWYAMGSAQADSLDPVTSEETCQLKYAWTEFPPFMVPAKNKPTGAQIKLAEWVANEMGCQVNFINLNWKESIAAIESGDIDLMGRASITSERSEFARFSTSYRDEVLVLTVRKGESQTLQYRNMEDLFKRGFRLGILRGGYFGEELEPILAKPEFADNIIKHAKEGELLTSLKNKVIDGFFEEPFIIDNAVMTQSLYSEFEEYPIEMLVGKVHFMFSKQTVSDNQVKRFNEALSRVQSSERYKTHWYWSTIQK
ncbi:amino acid ABC transporter substrate-binding protein [Aliikangiella marina]|uniref:Amino acid ABC transporter substrate-binding protein n=1 Tax=Aliikangiella marina TaxID=1712262 RepID=A0A545TDH2_9GAMM|nr:transporter substrate-binding domain-containing protein [Aliikangiella marina]TQV75269.1 amino acid ABC transporter substrate-binding protein [Aliikangiella marina]